MVSPTYQILIEPKLNVKNLKPCKEPNTLGLAQSEQQFKKPIHETLNHWFTETLWFKLPICFV